jgi:hypothetical protein
MRTLVALAVMLAVAGCGSLPRPFLHEGNEAPLISPRAMQPISVAELPEMPGLAAALVTAFETEDIAASTAAGGDNFLRLAAKLEGGKLHWQLIDFRGGVVGDFTEARGGVQETAMRTAATVAHLLRGDDLGAADLAARPRVAVDKVTVSGSLDADLLRRSLIAALERQGIAVVEDRPQMRVSGALRITQGLAGHDLVEITWVVQDDKGNEIGKVNQGSPVMRDELLSKAVQMTHQIAEGGAEGVKQLVHTKY